MEQLPYRNFERARTRESAERETSAETERRGEDLVARAEQEQAERLRQAQEALDRELRYERHPADRDTAEAQGDVVEPVDEANQTPVDRDTAPQTARVRKKRRSRIAKPELPAKLALRSKRQLDIALGILIALLGVIMLLLILRG